MKSSLSHIGYLFFVSMILIAGFAGTSNAAIVPSERIKAAIIHHLAQIALEQGLDIETSIPNVLDVEVDEVDEPEVCVEVPFDKKLSKRVPVRVHFKNKIGKNVRSFRFTARVKIYKNILVICSERGRGEPISSGDVEVKRMDVSGFDDYFEDPELIGNMEARKKIKAGTILTRRNIQPVPVVKRGNKVVIKACVGNVVATAEGIAKQDGGKAETIRVYIEMTRSTLKCKVIDKDTVEVEM